MYIKVSEYMEMMENLEALKSECYSENNWVGFHTLSHTIAHITNWVKNQLMS